MATRRAFLAGMMAASLPRVGWADMGNPAFLAAGKAGGAFVLHGLSAAGESLFAVPLPGRGHAAAAHPVLAQAVAFARRPGTFALVLDCARGTVTARLEPPEGRQFNGHGVFSRDGGVLMTSEVVAEGSAGRIGLWETAGWRRIGEWDSGGIGPHDMKRLADGRLVVANGGIETDPKDRAKLNIATMQPNLTLLSADGETLEQVDLPGMPQNSIRHLALAGDGVAFAMQWEGDPAETVPQLGLWTPGAAPVPCPVAEDQAFALRGYAGSVAAAQGRIAVTSAPGGAVMLFGTDGAPLALHRRADVSGVAAGPDGLVVTDGGGGIWALRDDSLQLLAHHPLAWDNHLVSLA